MVESSRTAEEDCCWNERMLQLSIMVDALYVHILLFGFRNVHKSVSFTGAKLALCVVKESAACVWGWLMVMMTSFIWQMEFQIQQLSNLITEHMNKWIYSHNPSKPVAFILFQSFSVFHSVEHSGTNNTEHKTRNHYSDASKKKEKKKE